MELSDCHVFGYYFKTSSNINDLKHQTALF